MKRSFLHTRSFRCIHFSVFRYRWTENSFTGPKSFRDVWETGPWYHNTLLRILVCSPFYIFVKLKIYKIAWNNRNRKQCPMGRRENKLQSSEICVMNICRWKFIISLFILPVLSLVSSEVQHLISTLDVATADFFRWDSVLMFYQLVLKYWCTTIQKKIESLT